MFRKSSSPSHRIASVLASLAIVAAPCVLEAQATPAAAPTPLVVGQMAPDFTLTTVTSSGLTAKPFKLSEHRGETVVLAFFPKARTSGCTVQMESYRNRYDDLFNGGKKVTLIGVSIDSDTALTSWAKDAHFPFQFGADTDRAVGVAYGANNGSGYHKRTLYVIDGTGKITYVAAPFNQMAEDAYSQLGSAITSATPMK